MANLNRPNGLTPIGTLDGSPFNGNIRVYPVAAGNATAIFQGDGVILNDDGTVSPATAGVALLGACTGVIVNRAIAATEHPGYLPASTAGYVEVCVGTDVLYEIAEDSVGGAMVATNVGSNGDLVAGAGSTTTGRSGHVLDSSDVILNDATPASAQLRVIALVPRDDNAVGNYARWIVRINESQNALGGLGL